MRLLFSELILKNLKGTMKNFKSHKNFRKKAPPASVYSNYSSKVVKKLQKDKLWTLIIKGGTTLLVALLGLWVGSLPGLLIGSIVGYQGGKYLLELLKKRVKYIKKIFKNPYK
jgi:hypothetical protein